MPCYVFRGTGSDSKSYSFFACCNNPGWLRNSASPGGAYFTPAANYVGLLQSHEWWTTAGSITLCRTAAQLSAAIAGSHGTRGSCSGCLDLPAKYDCVNGSCVLATQHDTPGIYSSLEDCQSTCQTACALGQICVDPVTFCGPGKVCLERIEYNEIQSLLTRILSEI